MIQKSIQFALVFNCFVLFCLQGFAAADIVKPIVKPVPVLVPRLFCFSILCSFHRNAMEKKGVEKCKAASTFQKLVFENGAEVLDSSIPPFHPNLEVECDSDMIYSGPAVRFTDWNGTRIQAVPGPFPAVTLPPGSLRITHSFHESFLQLENQTLAGHCFVDIKPVVAPGPLFGE